MWGVVNNGSTQVLNLLIGICLGRLLTPADYGIVGVLTIFTALAGALQSSGFTQGLINMRQPTSNDYNAVFWFNVSMSLVLYALLFACAPLIALFFHQPCLTAVSRLVFLTLPLSAVGIASGGYMLKNMMNRQIAIAGVVALTASGAVGITLALTGHSYWSLAWQQLVYIGVLNACRFYYVSWRPSLSIDMSPVRRMMSFCMRLLLTNIINILNQNVLTFVFGRLFPISAVGNYSQANKWNAMAHSTISGAVGQIAQPVLVSVADQQEREVRVFRKLMRFTAFLSFPAMLGLALVARELIVLTIGPQWLGCVPLLQTLCVAGAFMPFYTLYQNLTISAGRSDIYLWLNVAQVALGLAIILLLHSHGIGTIVAAYTAFTMVWLLAWQIAARRLVDVRLAAVLADTVPFMLTAVAVMAATYYATLAITSAALLLSVRILMAAALYAAVMHLSGATVMKESVDFLLHRNHNS